MSPLAGARVIQDGEQIVGESIYLRLVEPADCREEYLKWLLEPEVHRFLETRWAEQTEASIRSFVASMRSTSENYLFAIVHLEKEEHVGNIKVGPINGQHRFADVSYFIGRRDMWGRGIASEAIALATRFGFERVGLHRMQAVVEPENAASAKALERAGYSLEGRLREKLFRDGEWRDQLVYGIVESSR